MLGGSVGLDLGEFVGVAGYETPGTVHHQDYVLQITYRTLTEIGEENVGKGVAILCNNLEDGAVERQTSAKSGNSIKAKCLCHDQSSVLSRVLN